MGEGIGSTEVSNSVVANVTDTTKLRKLKPLEATGERPTQHNARRSGFEPEEQEKAIMGGKHQIGHSHALLSVNKTGKQEAHESTHLHAASVIIRFPILVSIHVY